MPLVMQSVGMAPTTPRPPVHDPAPGSILAAMTSADGIRLDVQFTAGAVEWPRLLDATLAAEAGGYSAVWVVDHLAGRSMNGDNALEAFTWMGALAAATSSIEIGSLVVNVWNRSIGVAVVGAASVAAIADRPMWFGVGAGTSPRSSFAWEQQMVAAPIVDAMADRHARVGELLDLTDAMWHADDAAERFPTFPRPRHIPRVIVGVNSTALATLAGQRADGVNVRWSHPRCRELLDAATAAAGDRSFVRTVYADWDDALIDPDHPERQRMASLGVDRLILLATGVPPLG